MGRLCTVAVAMMLCVGAAESTQGGCHEASRYSVLSFFPSPIPVPRRDSSNSLVTVALAFSVSVCPIDVEYSIACRERALAEAVKRLRQIYLDVYVARRAAGTLKVWFPLVTEPSEQLRFLREVEERAIKTVVAELLAEGNQRTTSQMNSPRLKEPGTQPPETNPPEEPGQQEGSIRKRTRQVEKWREDANVEARKGTNWSHDWTSKTHSYQLGLAIHELARLDRGGD